MNEFKNRHDVFLNRIKRDMEAFDFFDLENISEKKKDFIIISLFKELDDCMQTKHFYKTKSDDLWHTLYDNNGKKKIETNE